MGYEETVPACTTLWYRMWPLETILGSISKKSRHITKRDLNLPAFGQTKKDSCSHEPGVVSDKTHHHADEAIVDVSFRENGDVITERNIPPHHHDSRNPHGWSSKLHHQVGRNLSQYIEGEEDGQCILNHISMSLPPHAKRHTLNWSPFRFRVVGRKANFAFPILDRSRNERLWTN